MAARLVAALPADPAAVMAVAARLTPEQRRGLGRLPWPLPSVADAVPLGMLSAPDRLLLLTVALAFEDDLDPVLAVDGRGVEEVRASGAAPHLVIHAGRVRFADPRMETGVHAAASAAEVAHTHARLAAVAVRRRDRVAAAWHRARGGAVRDQRSAAVLTAGARAAAAERRQERVLLLAAEAAKHAAGDIGEEARVLAGCAALACGHAADAEEWLGSLVCGAAEHRRGRALGPFLVARTFRYGAVPAVDPQRLAPLRTGDGDSWARFAALLAILCAERGDRRAGRRWLADVRDGASRVGGDGVLRDAVESLCGLLAGEVATGDVPGTGGLLGAVSGALHAACGGDIDEGLRLLQTADLPGVGERDPMIPGFEHSPLGRAYRIVTEVLLLVWRGDIGRARLLLRRAAVELPVAIPFAGLGVVLARRLDLAVLGAFSPIARALTAVLPPAADMDVLVDRAVEAFLNGSFEAAAGAIGLWRDRGEPQARFAVPGVEEVVLVPDAGRASPAVRPPETEFADALRHAVAASGDGAWRTEQETLREAARRLRSPFARGRVEMLLGVRSGLHGDPIAARSHLGQAERLFEAAGASAWGRAVRRRLQRLETDPHVTGGAYLFVCRSAWAQRLTSRELEVAMLAVEGTGNRAIAERLSISVRTVEVHLGRVFAKLDVRNRVELTVLAHRTEQYL
ncbi:helix-turn-helix transcriptional regulator [Microbacterium paraoxydans]|uniref:helix-turn-helix domain-containing protein n=1 Tax=Microbacterium TaxID=33882 RepID=UPI000D012D17|nr:MULTISPECIES: helix-turn-helix transcriptional regulator [Microbacterium]AVL96839.1 hypothetical protein C6C15_06845 [Microbacterium sp. str. 'China']